MDKSRPVVLFTIILSNEVDAEDPEGFVPCIIREIHSSNGAILILEHIFMDVDISPLQQHEKS